jgi:hypothetical protein
MTIGVMPLRPVPSMRDLERLPTSAMAEADLVAGYAGAVRVEPCACGGVIRAHANDRAIAYAVTGHNASERHRAWRLEEDR